MKKNNVVRVSAELLPANYLQHFLADNGYLTEHGHILILHPELYDYETADIKVQS